MDRIHNYDTVEGICENELALKGSHFISIIMLCPDESSIQTNIAEVMNRYRDATHYCWTAVYNGSTRRERDSDNGEPLGTAGKIILFNFKGSDLLDVICIIIKYFDGILPRTGGLVHTYRKTSKLVLRELGTAPEWSAPSTNSPSTTATTTGSRTGWDIMARRPECECSNRMDVVAYIPSGKEEEFERRITDFTERHVKLWRMDDEYLGTDWPRDVM